MSKFIEYNNGPWRVTLDTATGTKTRTRAPVVDSAPMQPETFDLKVTDFCNAGCKWCHEDSTVRGAHAELEPLQAALSVLRPGFEVAIGGGDPMAWPPLDDFLRWVNTRGGFANITVNGAHIKRAAPRLRAWQAASILHGIGVSATGAGIERRDFNLECVQDLQNVVGHVILGRVPPDALEGLASWSRRTYQATHEQDSYLSHYLLLGSKRFGRGVQNFVQQEESGSWSKKPYLTPPLEVNLFLRVFSKAGIGLSFDNLALEQGQVKAQVKEEVWNQYYMGEDGAFSMYVDAVKQQWAVTSTTPREQRVSWADVDMLGFFGTHSGVGV